MRLRHASGSTPQNLSSSSGHASKAYMRSAQAPWLQRKPRTMHPPSFPRPLLLADARSALCAEEHKPGTSMRCKRGGAPSTAEAAEAPIRSAPERRKRCLGPSRACSGSTLLPWPKSAQNGANTQQWSRGRVRGLAYWLAQPSARWELGILGSMGRTVLDA